MLYTNIHYVNCTLGPALASRLGNVKSQGEKIKKCLRMLGAVRMRPRCLATIIHNAPPGKYSAGTPVVVTCHHRIKKPYSILLLTQIERKLSVMRVVVSTSVIGKRLCVWRTLSCEKKRLRVISRQPFNQCKGWSVCQVIVYLKNSTPLTERYTHLKDYQAL